MATPPQGRAAPPPTEQRYYIDPEGQVVQRTVPVEERPPLDEPAPQYRYYRRPDGTVVRQRVASSTRPVASATAPPAAAPATRPAPPPRPTPAPRPLGAPPRWTGKRIAKHLFVILVIILLLLASWPMVKQPLHAMYNMMTSGEPGFQTFPKVAEFTILREMSLTAQTNSLTFTIDIPKPFDIPGIHERLGLTTVPTPASEEQRKGQDWMLWSGAIGTGGTETISVTYHMKLYATMWDVAAKDSADVSAIPATYDKYLVDEWKITPSDPEVKALAAEIVGSETNVYTILLKIYKWMDDNLVYRTQRSAEPKSCSETLATRAGDCDDQSILLASLARSIGVPVWLNLGIIYDPVRDYWGGHGWNNVYIPLKSGDFDIATVDIVNKQFLFRDPYHVSDYIDDGVSQDLKDYYTSWSYSYTGQPPNAKSSEKYTVEDLKTTGSVIYYSP
jgi:hypothetical protein